MADQFYPVRMDPTEGLFRAPGRLLFADLSQPFPTQISDIIDMSTFAAKQGWTDVGATKGGVSISFNNSEESLTIDQSTAEIASMPTTVEMTVSTQLSEATLEWLAWAWEGDSVTTNVSPTVAEKVTHFGPFESYTVRRLAVGARRPQTGRIRFFVFRKAQRAPADSSLEFNSTGDQQTIPVEFRILPDTSVPNIKQQFATVFDQVA